MVRLSESALQVLGDRFCKISNVFLVLNLRPYPTRSSKRNAEVLSADGTVLILLSDFFEVIDEAG